MARTLDQFESEIQPLIRDRTSGTVETNDIRDALNRCIRLLKEEHGIYASKNRSVISVFPTIYEYPMPSDFADPINIVNRGIPMNMSRKTANEFWFRLGQEDNMIATDAITGDRFLLIKNSRTGSSATMHTMESLTDNGTWTADTVGSDALDIAVDSGTFKQGSNSIKFDVDVSQSGSDYALIENSTLTSVDLSAAEDIGTMFAWVYLPTVTDLSSILMRWGSSSSDYWEQSVTTQFNGQAFRVGWNRVGFAWNGATETGTPVATAVDYLQVRIVYTASFTDASNFRVDDIKMETSDDLELTYYSDSFVQSSAGVLQDSFSETSDLSLLTDSEDDILLYYALAEVQKIKEAFNESQLSMEQFERRLRLFKSRHLSERKLQKVRYY